MGSSGLTSGTVPPEPFVNSSTSMSRIAIRSPPLELRADPLHTYFLLVVTLGIIIARFELKDVVGVHLGVHGKRNRQAG